MHQGFRQEQPIRENWEQATLKPVRIQKFHMPPVVLQFETVKKSVETEIWEDFSQPELVL